MGEWHVTDDEHVEMIIRNSIKHNKGYCPCVPDSIGKECWLCPCEKMRSGKGCHCGLYEKG